METGRTVILLNLESLYESLYDALNQVCHLLRETTVIGCSVCSVICQIDYCGLGIAPFLLEKGLLEAENI